MACARPFPGSSLQQTMCVGTVNCITWLGRLCLLEYDGKSCLERAQRGSVSVMDQAKWEV